MNKSKLKSLVKAARKTAKESIELKVIADLQAYTTTLGQETKKLNKEIKKGAKKLAKKLAKDIRIDKAALIDSTKEFKAVGLSDGAPQ